MRARPWATRIFAVSGDWIFGQTPPGTIFVWSDGKYVSKHIREAIGGRATWVKVDDPWSWPRRSHFYVTHIGLCAAVERAAATISATVVVVPEQVDWLRTQLASRVAAQQDTFIYQATRKGQTPLWAPGPLKTRT